MTAAAADGIGGRIHSALLFLASYPFAKTKLHAVGISNLPAALRAYRRAKGREVKNGAHRKLQAFGLTLFHLAAVFAGLFDRHPRLIQVHEIVAIGMTVRDSVASRREKKEREEQGLSISGRLQRWMFGPSPSAKDDDVNDAAQKSKTAKAQKIAGKTRSILKGQCNSTTDDLMWGAFHASFVLLDQSIGRALVYAWLLFLLTILEEAVLNPKLRKEQRARRGLWIVATGYFCGRFLFGARLF